MTAPRLLVRVLGRVLPRSVLRVWRRFGFEGFGRGLFWVTDPLEWEPVVSEWLDPVRDRLAFSDTWYCLARSAMGNLFLWGRWRWGGWGRWGSARSTGSSSRRCWAGGSAWTTCAWWTPAPTWSCRPSGAWCAPFYHSGRSPGLRARGVEFELQLHGQYQVLAQVPAQDYLAAGDLFHQEGRKGAEATGRARRRLTDKLIEYGVRGFRWSQEQARGWAGEAVWKVAELHNQDQVLGGGPESARDVSGAPVPGDRGSAPPWGRRTPATRPWLTLPPGARPQRVGATCRWGSRSC
ncbi:hypothetical protein D5R93_09355 [Actinomyces lilanjuaniae]|uniref:GAD-related domain-containing protein n=1 Tax=Actinomyces lilanjuaniae TaxID=2321394 RepID=A0ABM6Z498_9ACTO|nr:GAD-like domain-containing protein [Actinomyces lilanjuaniae]AYD90155.1 hypothetical protein D5R93_09355 [Actinomyces lilanjuaniae]